MTGIGIGRGFRELGVWSKPSGAPFLCIEPWRGYASPKDFDGELGDKPGLMHIAAGAEEELSYRIEVGSPEAGRAGAVLSVNQRLNPEPDKRNCRCRGRPGCRCEQSAQ
jgi:hypothetical protein